MQISQQGQRQYFDVLVIGAGIAGLSFVLQLANTQPNLKIALLCKRALLESNTQYAQGGIAAVIGAGDTLNKHLKDTLAAGAGLSDHAATQQILAQSKTAIEFLQQQGAIFDSNGNNKLNLAQEGGHSERRIVHFGDQTGKAIVNALTAQLVLRKNIHIFEHHCAVNLITQMPHHVPGSRNEVIGAYVLEESTQLIHTFLAKITVLATGGAGKTFRYTSNPDVATGDGIAMAYRVGARVGNMEFYQFHPTLLYHPACNNFLLTEALRGEGAHLLLPTQKRFMQDYAPKQMELATRDIVARAIFSEIERGGFSYVYLDIRHKEEQFLRTRFPGIAAKLQELGLNLARDLIPVVPAAHYLCGGILTNAAGETDLLRLYALGETAFTGLHGGNRLASNSLLEGVVMGLNAARICTDWLTQPWEISPKLKDWDSHCVIDLRRASQINSHWRSLRGEMSSYAGIVRTEAGLRDVLTLVLARSQMIEKYYWQHVITPDLIELRNIVLVAELIVRSALKRQESRGCHFREDYPALKQQAEDSIMQLNAGEVTGASFLGD